MRLVGRDGPLKLTLTATCVLQAQIALANTALTVLGMWLLQIPGIGLLGLFVFICSFIPIAGVFISTVPMAFVALTEYGFIKVSTHLTNSQKGLHCSICIRQMVTALRLCQVE